LLRHGQVHGEPLEVHEREEHQTERDLFGRRSLGFGRHFAPGEAEGGNSGAQKQSEQLRRSDERVRRSGKKAKLIFFREDL
jgi:predicted NUDIX family phosphoesterase